MASDSSESVYRAMERRAASLLALAAAGALTCVLAAVLASRWEPGPDLAGAELAQRLLSVATALVVVAPLVSLASVALGARRTSRGMAACAVGSLLVALLGTWLAR